MRKLLRTLVIGFSISLLAAGASLAGPGGRTSGDPDRPQGANSGDSWLRTAETVEVRSEEVTGSRVASLRETATRDDWSALVQVYLQLLRTFVF